MDTLKILGIDPGSYTSGFACVTIDLRDWSIIKIETSLVDTIDVTDTSYFKNTIYVRMKALTLRTISLMEFYEPDVVSIEAGYIDRFRPAAYGALSKTMLAIVSGVRSYDHLMTIGEFSPKVAKRLIGVTNQNKKETTLEALKKNKVITDLIDLDKISEHEVDAISLAFPLIDKFKDMKILPI